MPEYMEQAMRGSPYRERNWTEELGSASSEIKTVSISMPQLWEQWLQWYGPIKTYQGRSHGHGSVIRGWGEEPDFLR
jgi:hypothetical protein